MRHMSLVQLSILSDVINAIISSASEQDEALAQKYLVRVWTGARSTTTTETFDQLPLENYTSASAGIDSFPPTSSVIKGRNRKGPFLVHTACKLLANIDDPETGLALGRSTLVSFCPQSALSLYHRVCSHCASVRGSVTLDAVVALLRGCCAVRHILSWKAGTSPCENLPRND